MPSFECWGSYAKVCVLGTPMPSFECWRLYIIGRDTTSQFDQHVHLMKAINVVGASQCFYLTFSEGKSIL
jgi:hypothetical protein